jgi:DNA-binding NtrC family response regulator
MATVLVVDDNRSIRTSLAELLRSTGYDVFEAEDAESALRLLAEQDVGAVVLDMRMPGGGGLAVLDALENPPPVIITSGYALDLDAQTRVDAKIFVQLVKPFHPRRLLDAVAAAIGPPEETAGIDG